MSSNLLKRGFTQLVEEDARVIDTNDLVAKRIRELAAKMQQDEGTGFISGLAADKVEALVTDTGDGEENPQTSGNVIKAGEDLQKLKEEAEAEAQKIIEDAKAKAVSIDELESQTGIDFFCNLPDYIEDDVESGCQVTDWTW